MYLWHVFRILSILAYFIYGLHFMLGCSCTLCEQAVAFALPSFRNVRRWKGNVFIVLRPLVVVILSGGWSVQRVQVQVHVHVQVFVRFYLFGKLFQYQQHPILSENHLLPKRYCLSVSVTKTNICNYILATICLFALDLESNVIQKME